MLRPLYLSFIILMSSCALNRTSVDDELRSQDRTYKQIEVSGEYLLKTNTGFGKGGVYIRKSQLVDSVNQSQVFEKTIVISKKKKVLKNVYFLVPQKYESTFYLNRDVYTVSGELDLKNRKIVYNLNSPEYKWLGQKSYSIPEEVKAICFYSTVIECAKVSGFIKKAIEKKNGDMSFHILWESYPYFQAQYLNMPKEILSFARLSADGRDKKGNYRFLLSVGGQSQVYLLNKRLDIVGHYWTAQGLSKEPIK